MNRVTHGLVLLGPVVILGGCCDRGQLSSARQAAGPKAAVAKVGAASSRIDVEAIVSQLVAIHGEAATARIRTGVKQVTRIWRPADGSAAELLAFAKKHFVAAPKVLADTFAHLQYALEMIDGHAHSVRRELSRYQALDEGPVRPIDGLLAIYTPTAHLLEDLFSTKIGFVALLNFPVTTLEQRLSAGQRWSREQWAQARLTGRFEHRVPAPVLQRIAGAKADVRAYIDGYNIHLDRLISPAGQRLFPAGLKLISHWGLRDEIRAQYTRRKRGRGHALERQRLIVKVMERIVRQEIPAAVIDARELQWDPTANRVRAGAGPWRASPREPDARYRQLKRVFDALRAADPYYPSQPTHIQRVFLGDREIPEDRVRRLLEAILTSKAAHRVAAVLRQRLGRPLEPFDIWYSPKETAETSTLDAITRQRYPDASALQADIPSLLGQLGFDSKTAAWLGTKIVVDPSRGAGHAYGAKRRHDQAHLRTRVGKQGVDYKGFNIAVHELGHNVEQVFSMSRIDHTLLEGVPNTGFSEAFAFLFQDRDLELLGHQTSGARAEALRTLDRFWTTFEIGGVAMLDIELWRWMVGHPDASPAELRQAMVRLAKQVWNRYFAPVLGVKDSVLLAIYSHIIAYGLYTPDYPLGLLITFQIEQHLRQGKQGRGFGLEVERMCRLGRLAPDVWMRRAVGKPVSAAPLIAATKAALERLSAAK